MYRYRIRFRLYGVPQITGTMAENSYWSLLERIAQRYMATRLGKGEHPLVKSSGTSALRGDFMEVAIHCRTQFKKAEKIFWIHP